MDFSSFRLAASTADLSEAPAAREHADLVEYRMDLAADGVDPLRAYDGDLPILVTNRVDWEGGDAADTPARLDALVDSVHLPSVEAVDLELRALTEGDADRVLEAATEAGVTTVVSTHDFETTPDCDKLVTLLEQACDWGAVGKLAVTATDTADVLDVLSVTEELTAAGHQVATMAMGEAGRHSRAVAPLYGSKIGYAPVDPDDATAPGQYDLHTLRTLVSTLQPRNA
jgi:3-dehydroquinate dehydratase-1